MYLKKKKKKTFTSYMHNAISLLELSELSVIFLRNYLFKTKVDQCRRRIDPGLFFVGLSTVFFFFWVGPAGRSVFCLGLLPIYFFLRT